MYILKLALYKEMCILQDLLHSLQNNNITLLPWRNCQKPDCSTVIELKIHFWNYVHPLNQSNFYQTKWLIFHE